MMPVKVSRLTPTYGARILAARISMTSTEADVKKTIDRARRRDITEQH